MKHTAVTFDDRKFVFEDSKLGVITVAMRSGAPIQLPGGIVKGSDIRRIEDGDTTGAHSKSSYVPQLAEPTRPDSEQFWKRVLMLNHERKANGLPWLYSAAILWAIEQNGHHNLDQLLAFIHAEWETSQVVNVAIHPNDNPSHQEQLRREASAYLTSDDGADYYHRWRASDMQDARERRFTSTKA